MPKSTITRQDVLQDHHGRTFADVLNAPGQPFDAVLDFFICGGRQRPVQTRKTHHGRIPLAGVVREIEAQSPINDLFSSKHPLGTKRSRQAMGVVTHLGLEHHGWKQTGERSSLWAFEHRWTHRRDHAEGRNHRLPTD